jgi:hypothetical protein
MPQADALRWNERYQNEPRYASFVQPRPFLVEQAGWLPQAGLALDAAMGMGGNAGFLMQRGLGVVGVDISTVAVSRAKARLPGLLAVVADMAHFRLPDDTLDVILNFFYLERSLWPAYWHWLKPGGLLVFETLTVEMLARNPACDPAFLLEPGELRQAFADWEILIYQEGWRGLEGEHPRATAAVVARKRYGH